MNEARQLLINWANAQSGWVKLAVNEIIDTRQPIPNEILEEIYHYFLDEKGLGQGEIALIENINFVEQTNGISEKFFLKEMNGVQNVNRLTSNQALKFNPGITVIFGENASGKSGYVRILKKLAAARSQEDILPDITKTVASGSPKAELLYGIGDKVVSLSWGGEKGVIPFNRISIFDSRALTSHVDENLTYVYTPRDLSLFKLTHTTIEWVRTRLDAEKKKLKPGSNPFLARFSKDNNLYSKIETLGPTTDIKELEDLAQFGQDEEALMLPLVEQVEALNPQLVASKLEAAENRRILLAQGIALAKIVTTFNWSHYNDLVSKANTAKEHYINATEKAFIGSNFPGILTEPWKKFIEAGEEFLKENKSADYPEINDSCIYCQQPLESAAVDLLKKYKAYCTDALRTDVQNIEREINSFEVEINYPELEEYIKTLQKRLSHPQSQNKELLEIKLEFALQYKNILEEYRRRNTLTFDVLKESANKVYDASNKLLVSTDELISILKKQGEERRVALTASLPKLKNLEARKVLKGVFPEIKQYVENSKWVSKAESILNTLPTLLRSLTAQSKIASEDLLNKDFQTFFEQECIALKTPVVKLDFPGHRGEAARRKSLSTRYRLSDILSEGEQKVIALADFLAESSIRKTSSPLVFDDPVNSLDYKRMEYIVDRIDQLSIDQQVIVFTHNIWFATSLLSRFESDTTRCTYYDMAESGGIPGFIRSGTHPRWDTVSALRGKVNSMIQSASSLEGETQLAMIERVYDVLRSWCEVVVEQELLCKVAQRYTPHIAMGMLNKIKADKLSDAVNGILPIFNKCCRFMPGHSQPLETLGIRVTIDELKEDWRSAQEALKTYQG